MKKKKIDYSFFGPFLFILLIFLCLYIFREIWAGIPMHIFISYLTKIDAAFLFLLSVFLISIGFTIIYLMKKYVIKKVEINKLWGIGTIILISIFLIIGLVTIDLMIDNPTLDFLLTDSDSGIKSNDQRIICEGEAGVLRENYYAICTTVPRLNITNAKVYFLGEVIPEHETVKQINDLKFRIPKGVNRISFELAGIDENSHERHFETGDEKINFFD